MKRYEYAILLSSGATVGLQPEWVETMMKGEWKLGLNEVLVRREIQDWRVVDQTTVMRGEHNA